MKFKMLFVHGIGKENELKAQAKRQQAAERGKSKPVRGRSRRIQKPKKR